MTTQVAAATRAEQQEADGRRSAWTTRLLDNRSFRLEQIAELTAQLKAGPTRAHAEVARLMLAAARLSLQETHDALARLAAGQFGICLECREPVEGQRLDVLPMAALCTGCQFLVEIGSVAGSRRTTPVKPVGNGVPGARATHRKEAKLRTTPDSC